MAIALAEPKAAACREALENSAGLLISSATLAEALIVAARRGIGDRMDRVLTGFGFEAIEVTPAVARRVAAIYGRWGKGVHPAGLNFCDCFAYDVAREHAAKLLYVGNDFAQTDIASAL